MATFINYLRFSNIQIIFDLNPLVWGFTRAYQGPSEHDPALHEWVFRILFLVLHIVIDDGSWVPHDEIREFLDE